MSLMLFNLSLSSFYSLLKKGCFLFVIMLVVISNPVHAEDDILNKFKDKGSTFSFTVPTYEEKKG